MPININIATESDLESTGILPEIAKYIIESRNYYNGFSSTEDLNKIELSSEEKSLLVQNFIFEPVIENSSEQMNINDATESDLQALGIDPEWSKYIIDSRNYKGRFINKDDLNGLELSPEFINILTSSFMFDDVTVNISKGYYDWPEKFNKGDSVYDQGASDWIESNRKIYANDPEPHEVDTRFGKGYSYEGPVSSDPEPDWKESDTLKIKGYKAIWEELAGEGSLDAINTYDNQQVTIGKGFSLKYISDHQPRHDIGILILEYNIKDSADFKNTLLEVGLYIIDGSIVYKKTNEKLLLKGNDAMIGFKWNKNVLSALISAFKKNQKINADNQFRVLKEKRLNRLPDEFYSWSYEAQQIITLFSQWAPASIHKDILKNSSGKLSNVVHGICKGFQKSKKGGYSNDFSIEEKSNGALYVNDLRRVLARRADGVFLKQGKDGKILRTKKSEFDKTNFTKEEFKNYVFLELNDLKGGNDETAFIYSLPDY